MTTLTSSCKVFVTLMPGDEDGAATFAKLTSTYELMEMQGDITPIDTKVRDFVKGNDLTSAVAGDRGVQQPLPMGTFLLPAGYGPKDPLPAKKASCNLRLGTLSLEGEVGPPLKTMSVLRRITENDEVMVQRGHTSVMGGKRPRDDDEGLPAEMTDTTPVLPLIAESGSGGYTDVDSLIPCSFAQWYSKRTEEGGDVPFEGGSSSAGAVAFELVGIVKKRYHFKTKPTRQF